MFLISKKIIKAVNYATQKHANQLRKDRKTPYIAHPLAVALIISNINGFTPSCVIAAILHDTLEDTTATTQELSKLFGKKVCSIVQQLTEEKNTTRINRKTYSLEKIKMYTKEAAIVKYCDILCNMQELEIQIKQDINIIYCFNWTIKDKLSFEFKRLKAFNKFHSYINTSELQKTLKNSKTYLQSVNLYT